MYTQPGMFLLPSGKFAHMQSLLFLSWRCMYLYIVVQYPRLFYVQEIFFSVRDYAMLSCSLPAARFFVACGVLGLKTCCLYARFTQTPGSKPFEANTGISFIMQQVFLYCRFARIYSNASRPHNILLPNRKYIPYFVWHGLVICLECTNLVASGKGLEFCILLIFSVGVGEAFSTAAAFRFPSW